MIQKAKTTQTVFPGLIFFDPAMAASPIANTAIVQNEITSIEPARDLIAGEVPAPRNAPRFVGTAAVGSCISIDLNPSSSLTIKTAMNRMFEIIPIPENVHRTTENIFL